MVGFVRSHPKRPTTPRTKTRPRGPQCAFRMGHPAVKDDSAGKASLQIARPTALGRMGC